MRDTYASGPPGPTDLQTEIATYYSNMEITRAIEAKKNPTPVKDKEKRRPIYWEPEFP